MDLRLGEFRGIKVLVVGCGNSLLPITLYNLGFRNITCIDTSTVVISQMQYRYHECEGLDYIVGDVRNLEMFNDESFDVIVDKGCIDCIFCSYISIDAVMMAYKEMHRLHKGTGKFISISYGTFEMRVSHMREFHWEVDVSAVAYSHGVSMFLAQRYPDKQRVKSFEDGKMLTGDDKKKSNSNMAKSDYIKDGKDKDGKPIKKKEDKAKLSKSRMEEEKASEYYKTKPPITTTRELICSKTSKDPEFSSVLSLQGIVLLTPAEELDLHLDPDQAFSFDAKGLSSQKEADLEAERLAIAEIAAENEKILAGQTHIEEDANTNIEALKAKMGLTTDPTNGKLKSSHMTGRKNSAIWKLAKTAIDVNKEVVFEGENDDKLLSKQEQDQIQN